MSLQASSLVKKQLKGHTQQRNHCKCLFAGVLVTLEPLPFANAEGPLQLLSTGQQPAHHTQPAHHQPEAQAVIGQPSSGHSPAKPAAAPGKSSLVVLLKHSKQDERYTWLFLQPCEIQQQPAGIFHSRLTVHLCNT